MKKLLSIIVLGLLLSGNGYSESWDVIDIPDKGIKQGDKAWPFAREQAISLCRQKKKFAFQFHATDFSSQTHFPKRMRYFCSRDRLTVDPIEGPTVTYKAFLWAKQREEPNPLIWNNFSEKQKKYGILKMLLKLLLQKVFLVSKNNVWHLGLKKEQKNLQIVS